MSYTLFAIVLVIIFVVIPYLMRPAPPEGQGCAKHGIYLCEECTKQGRLDALLNQARVRRYDAEQARINVETRNWMQENPLMAWFLGGILLFIVAAIADLFVEGLR